MLDVSTSRPWPWPEVRSLNFLYLTAITALLFLGHCDATYFPVNYEAPLHFASDENTVAYFVSIQITGKSAVATAQLINCSNNVVSESLSCEPGACQVVEARNITKCSNSPATNSPSDLAPVSSQQDASLLSDFLQRSEKNGSVEIWQYATVASYPGGRRLSQAISPPAAVSELFGPNPSHGGPPVQYLVAPSPPDTQFFNPNITNNCSSETEMTFYLTYPAAMNEVRLNQTLALFSGGIFFSKMVHTGFAFDNVTLLSYQELDMSPATTPSEAPLANASASNTVITKAGNIPGPKPAVTSNDSTPGPVSFVLTLDGPDALVTNDTLLTVLYDMLTNSTTGDVSTWFNTLNTVISNVNQNAPEVPKRLHRRSLLQTDSPGPSTGSSCLLFGSNAVPSLSVTTKLFQVPHQATEQVQAELNALVDENILLNGFNMAGLRICAVALTSFSADSTAPAPGPSSNGTATFATRSGSNHGVVVIALSIAIPVSIVGTAAIILALLWYRKHKTVGTAQSQSKLRLKFSGDSSLFGSPRNSNQVEGSAQSIIHQLHNDSFSSRSRLIDMPWSDWKIEPSELTIATRPDGSEWLLGAGASGRVYKALRNGVQIVAVKVFKEEATRGAITSLTSPQHAAQFKQEISILKSCHDKNIVQFVGACLAIGQTILVTEYLENGDLYKAINSQQGNRYHWYRMLTPDSKPLPNSGMARRVALDIARGLHFLHTRKIVHFDLKSANILLARDFTAKIADVGLARILHDDVLSSRKEVGTFAWAAPEVLLGQRITEAADIYSFGVLLHELSAVESPRQRQLRPLNVPAEAPEEIADLMSRCLDVDPRNRPTARDLVAMLSCMPNVPPFPPSAQNPVAAADVQGQNPLIEQGIGQP